MSVNVGLSKQLVIGEVVARWARKTPSKEAFVFDDKRYTWRQFNERVNRLANGLMGLGIKRGDKVAFLLMNCMEIMECHFAPPKVGVVAVPLNFRLASRELIYQLGQSDSKAIIFDEMYQDVVNSIRSELPKVKHYICVSKESIPETINYEELLQKSSPEEPLVPVDDDDPAYIFYTSGTTGRPKGAVLTHKNLFMDNANILCEMDINSSDRFLCIPPLFHLGALGVIQKFIWRGSTSVIMQRFVPEDIPKLIEKERITFIWLVPSMWNSLLQAPDIADYDLSSLRLGSYGAAVMPPEVMDKILKQFPNIRMNVFFGQTEMSPCVTFLKTKDAIRKLGSVGERVNNVELRIVDDNDNDVPIGQVGEAIYRGPTVMKEYYKMPEATAEAMKGGWFHSGDLVCEDEEGFIYVKGRKKDMIISGGENIYPAEVEEVLYTHPKILEAAVIGVPDPQWGESVKAIVVTKPGGAMAEEEVIEYCKQNLASYKKPKSVEFVDALPRNPAGKVLKYELRERYKK